MKIPDLLNTNTLILVEETESLDEINNIYEKVGLALPTPFLLEKNWYDTFAKVYIHVLENNLEYVTCFTTFAYPRKDIIEKFNNEFKDFDMEWGIISWSRTGEISGWHPGEIKTFINEKNCAQIAKNIISKSTKVNDYLINIPYYSFGIDAFSITTESFPLFLDRVNFYKDYPSCALADADYNEYVKSYHTKDLYFANYNRLNRNWEYPSNYNLDRSGYMMKTKVAPEGFSIIN